MSSPTQRSLDELRKEFPLVQVVEKWIPQARKRVDLYGIGDILCVSDTAIRLVQTTSGDNVAARVQKIADSPAVPILRKAGIEIHVHGWRKSRRTKRWELRVVDCS